MKLIDIKDEDCINFKEISMFIAMPYCNGKCYKELGLDSSICQNDALKKSKIIDIDQREILTRYLQNQMSTSIVFGGLEPMDSFNEIYSFIKLLRLYNNDYVVIYTGYKEEEIKDKIEILKSLKNIILKVGRYIPNSKNRYDEILGVTLASDNQYAIKL